MARNRETDPVPKKTAHNLEMAQRMVERAAPLLARAVKYLLEAGAPRTLESYKEIALYRRRRRLASILGTEGIVRSQDDLSIKPLLDVMDEFRRDYRVPRGTK